MDTPILIAGAGPAGLTLAILLQQQGISFRIIDKQIKPVPTSNALAVQMRTLQIWKDLGLLEQALKVGNKITHFRLNDQASLVGEINTSLLKKNDFLLGLSQHHTESIMLEYLHEQGIQVEMEVSLVRFVEHANHITVTLRSANGQEETLNTNWLIAADGLHSIIREELHIPFRGHALPQHFVMADIKTPAGFSKEEVNAFLSTKGLFFAIHYNRKYTRLIAEVSHHPHLKTAKSLTPEEITRLLQERTHLNFKVEKPIWTSGFWIQERLIQSYQHDHIFFMGDAAHVHSPIGGQGMNTGIQDAYNLGWKLAWFMKTHKEAILKTYHNERYPVAKAVLKSTTMMTHLTALHNPFLIKFRNYFFKILLKMTWVKRQFLNLMAGFYIHYPPSIIVADHLPNHAGPKPGQNLLDVAFKKGEFSDYLSKTGFTFLLFSGHETLSALEPIYQNLSSHYGNLATIVVIHQTNTRKNNKDFLYDTKATLHQAYQIKEPVLYLIRPDKYIGLRTPANNLEPVQQYFQNIL